MARKTNTTNTDGAETPAPSFNPAPAPAPDSPGQPVPAVGIVVGCTVQAPAPGTNVNDPLELVTGTVVGIDGDTVTVRPIEFLDRTPSGRVTPRKSVHFTRPDFPIAAAHCRRVG